MARLLILNLQATNTLNNECYQNVMMLSISRIVVKDEKLYKPFSQPQHIGVSRYSSNPVAGHDYVHKLSVSQQPDPRQAAR